VRSGEINSHVDDVQGRMDAVAKHFSDGKVDHLDGITVEYPDWWFNVRPSNTEPLLRLNVEAKTEQEMEQHRDEVLAIIRGNAK
jgi:phosphomannomutase